MMGFKEMIIRIVITLMLSSLISGCALWPYKHDFDCPVGEGVSCVSLYEISKMADRGEFGPNSNKGQTIDHRSAKQHCHDQSYCTHTKGHRR